MSVWVVDSAQLRDTFFELSAIGEPSSEGIVPTAVPATLFGALERAEVTEMLVEVPKVAREIAEVIDAEVDEATGTFWARMVSSGRLLRLHRRGCSGKILRMFSPSSPTPELQISQSENVG